MVCIRHRRARSTTGPTEREGGMSNLPRRGEQDAWQSTSPRRLINEQTWLLRLGSALCSTSRTCRLACGAVQHCQQPWPAQVPTRTYRSQCTPAHSSQRTKHTLQNSKHQLSTLHQHFHTTQTSSHVHHQAPSTEIPTLLRASTLLRLSWYIDRHGSLSHPETTLAEHLHSEL